MRKKKIDYTILLPNALVGALLLGGLAGGITYAVFPYFYPQQLSPVESARIASRRDRGGSEYTISRTRGTSAPMNAAGAGVLAAFGGGVAGWLLGAQRARQVMEARERDRRRQVRAR